MYLYSRWDGRKAKDGRHYRASRRFFFLVFFLYYSRRQTFIEQSGSEIILIVVNRNKLGNEIQTVECVYVYASTLCAISRSFCIYMKRFFCMVHERLSKNVMEISEYIISFSSSSRRNNSARYILGRSGEYNSLFTDPIFPFKNI